MSKRIPLTEGYWLFGTDRDPPVGTLHAWKNEDGTRLMYRMVAGNVVVRGDDPVDQSYVYAPIQQISKKEFFLYKLKGEA